MDGRIWFPGNPWPGGHRVRTFDWSGRLDGLGRLWFDLHLRTADYDEGDVKNDQDQDEDENGEPGERSDWESPIVWNNYHRCTISSTFWGEGSGLLAATAGRPFRLGGAEPQPLAADPLPAGDRDGEPAFCIYLLGHDSVADHRVMFTADGTGHHHVEWVGRVALTYAGDEEFRYEFRAEIRGARFAGVTPAAGMSVDEARQQLVGLLAVPADVAASLLTVG
jgi:hypothetical protein